MEHWTYEMESGEKDPIGNGDMLSWFEFYKMNAGVVHVPLERDYVKPGDIVWFVMDNVTYAGAEVIKTDYNIHTDEYDMYYDSDKMLMDVNRKPGLCRALRSTQGHVKILDANPKYKIHG